MTTAIIAGLSLAVIVLVYALRKERRISALTAAYVNDLKQSEAAAVSRLRSIYPVLDSYTGGVHKRIDEIREVAEAIQRRRPELYAEEYGLVHWLRASDQFLCHLRDVAMPEGCDAMHDEMRVLFAGTGRSEEIYEVVLDGIRRARMERQMADMH